MGKFNYDLNYRGDRSYEFKKVVSNEAINFKKGNSKNKMAMLIEAIDNQDDCNIQGYKCSNNLTS